MYKIQKLYLKVGHMIGFIRKKLQVILISVLLRRGESSTDQTSAPCFSQPLNNGKSHLFSLVAPKCFQ